MGPTPAPQGGHQPSADEDLEGVHGSRLRGKKNRVLKLYDRAPTRSHVVCFDEFGPMELRPIPGVSWARRRHPERHRATYTRKAGTEQLLAFYDVHGDVLEGVIHKRKTSRDILQAWQRLRRCYPRSHRLYMILDNFSSHWKSELQRFARHNKISLVPTPTYASWLNLIESQFTALKRFCLSNSDDHTHLERRRRIYRYLTLRNREVASSVCRLNIFRRY